MSVASRLSSQKGDMTEGSNVEVAVECLINPNLLTQLALELKSKDDRLVGDCAEVFTKVAEEKPELIAPYIKELSSLLFHKYNRARWEAVHAISLVVELSKEEFGPLVQKFFEMIKNDKSVIVRDYATDALGNYAKTGEKAAAAVFPLLIETLIVWNGKHAGHALEGLVNVAKVCPAFKGDLYGIGLDYAQHERTVISKAAKRLLKAIEKS